MQATNRYRFPSLKSSCSTLPGAYSTIKLLHGPVAALPSDGPALSASRLYDFMSWCTAITPWPCAAERALSASRSYRRRAGRVNRNDVPPGCDRGKHKGLVSAWLKLDSKGLGEGGRQGGAGGMYRGVVASKHPRIRNSLLVALCAEGRGYADLRGGPREDLGR